VSHLEIVQVFCTECWHSAQLSVTIRLRDNVKFVPSVKLYGVFPKHSGTNHMYRVFLLYRVYIETVSRKYVPTALSLSVALGTVCIEWFFACTNCFWHSVQLHIVVMTAGFEAFQRKFQWSKGLQLQEEQCLLIWSYVCWSNQLGYLLSDHRHCHQCIRSGACPQKDESSSDALCWFRPNILIGGMQLLFHKVLYTISAPSWAWCALRFFYLRPGERTWVRYFIFALVIYLKDLSCDKV
jgi:hypothetical protein